MVFLFSFSKVINRDVTCARLEREEVVLELIACEKITKPGFQI